MVHFWAKTTSEGRPGISVFEHMINVGCVARCLAEIWPEILESFNLRSGEVGALAGLHDIGKITPGFQRKCEAWLEENDLLKIARNGCWDTAMETDHGAVSHSTIQDFLMEQGAPRRLAPHLSALLGAHHGRIKFPPHPRGVRPPQIGRIEESASGIRWNVERRKNAQQVFDYFDAHCGSLVVDQASPALWWLAGLTTVADWIGSDERFFPAEGSIGDTNSPVLARKALESISFGRPQFVEGLSFHDLFHDPEKPDEKWLPNEMQEKAAATIIGPGVYVIEAPMGMGKTEAALWAAYRILHSGKATGLYFALPTQATSNRIHLRVNEFLRRISPEASPARLVHGNSWLLLVESEIQPVSTAEQKEDDDARAARDWFASTKRALLAPFGVGTIDQALLGVIAVKHFSVRQFALAGKVVILDEIHSYDIYTGTLIDRLIATLEGLGCTVIVLSATLTGDRRAEIVSCPDNPPGCEELPYPLITGRRNGVSLPPVDALPPKPRNVAVDFVTTGKAEAAAIAAAGQGGAVLWICNTVGSAQKQFRRLMQLSGNDFPIGLLHSRFPFWRRDQLEANWMERLGKKGRKRCGCILVSTQIVEQSVDLDADLMITELAPTDMLLQRLGRLWRHERERPQGSVARLYILEETADLEEFRKMPSDEIEKALGSKARVYAPFVLLRTLELWKGLECGSISIPSRIRQLIEATYKRRASEPVSWQQLSDNWCGRDSARKTLALWNCNLWQPALQDEEGQQTRINEVSTCALVLCTSLSKQEAKFVDGTVRRLEKGRYRLDLAQAVYLNLVKVPDYCFEPGIDSIRLNSAFSDYLHGMQAVGIVTESGAVEVKGLKGGIRLSYFNDFGLLIEKTSKQGGI